MKRRAKYKCRSWIHCDGLADEPNSLCKKCHDEVAKCFGGKDEK